MHFEWDYMVHIYYNSNPDVYLQMFLKIHSNAFNDELLEFHRK